MADFITDLSEDDARNSFLVGLVNALHISRKIIVLTDRREHCNKLCSLLENSGLYLGGMKQTELDVSASKRVIIASYPMAAEGLDIGDLDTVLLATPKTDVRQAIGRCMRMGGVRKNSPLVIDVVDKWGSLSIAMFNKRKRIYRSQNLLD